MVVIKEEFKVRLERALNESEMKPVDLARLWQNLTRKLTRNPRSTENTGTIELLRGFKSHFLHDFGETSVDTVSPFFIVIMHFLGTWNHIQKYVIAYKNM